MIKIFVFIPKLIFIAISNLFFASCGNSNIDIGTTDNENVAIKTRPATQNFNKI